MDWHALSDQQRKYLYFLIAAETYTPDQIKTLFLARCCVEDMDKLYSLQPPQLAQAISHLDWLEHPPTAPHRLEQLQGRTAREAELEETPYELYLSCETLYHSYLADTDNNEPLQQMAEILYPDDREKPLAPLSPAERINVLLWWIGLKQLLARQYPSLFKPIEKDSAQENDLAETTNAMIRALTGGDVTKEQLVLEVPTWRALTELEAKVKEAKLATS